VRRLYVPDAVHRGTCDVGRFIGQLLRRGEADALWLRDIDGFIGSLIAVFLLSAGFNKAHRGAQVCVKVEMRIARVERFVIKRVIHTTADFDYADNLTFSDHAVQKGIAALKGGCDIVTDTQMAKAGINKTILASLGGEVHCFMSGPDVAQEARSRGVTRAFARWRKRLRSRSPASSPSATHRRRCCR